MESGHTEDYFKGLSMVKSNSGSKLRNSINCNTESSSVDSEDSESNESLEEEPILHELFSEKEAKFISPKYWEAGVWKDSEACLLGNKLKQTEFTVLSWNVYFGLRCRRTRMEELGLVIKEKDPDFICLQEVTPDIMSCLVAQSWCKLYFVSDLDARYVSTYGNVIFSKIKLNECLIHPLTTKLGRKLILGNVVIDNKSQLSIGTFHLESPSKDGDVRRTQFQSICSLAENLKHFIVCGDTNFFEDDEEGDISVFGLKDAWKELKQKTPEQAEQNPGFTFDTVENIMCNAEYKERDDYMVKRKRLDRCYYSQKTLLPLSIEIVGKNPYYESEWISDHYGIFTTFQRL